MFGRRRAEPQTWNEYLEEKRAPVPFSRIGKKYLGILSSSDTMRNQLLTVSSCDDVREGADGKINFNPMAANPLIASVCDGYFAYVFSL